MLTHNVQSGAAHPCMPYRCRGCGKRFSVRTGSVMTESKLGYQVWVIAIYLLTSGLKGVSSMKLHRDLGITQESAWHLAHRIRAAVGARVGAVRRAGGGRRDLYRRQGRQQALGQEAERRARDGRQDAGGGRARPGHTGGGGTTGRGTRKDELQCFVRERVDADAQVYSDDSKSGVSRLW